MAVVLPHLGGHVGPGMQRPRPACPGPAPRALARAPAPAPTGSGNSCRGWTLQAELRMEPVEAWTPGKVAAWLRGR